MIGQQTIAVSGSDQSAGQVRPDEESRWRAVVTRDASCDGEFLYGVMTTGVYCRPSCSSRQPLRKNVRFFDSAWAAERAGLRPCKRCLGGDLGQRHARLIERACRTIEAAEETPALEQLAVQAGLSAHHFQRVFKKQVGLSPRQYAMACREQRLRATVAGQQSITDSLFDAGFGSSSRFYEQANDVLGMSPSTRRAQGKGEVIRFALGECSLGTILVAASKRGICHIALGDAPEALLEQMQRDFSAAELVGGDGAFEQTIAKVVALVEAPGTDHDLPLDIRGTAFQKLVWNALTKIPAGATASYADVARAIGRPTASRAVAQACGANRLAVAIPCHRVVRSDGGLSGYRWGVERKECLLSKEASA